jgi:ABC-2 type transport system permease protein
MNDGSHLGIHYGFEGNSKSLVLIGYLLWNFSTMAINTISSSISSEASRGTLEQKFMSIIPLHILLLGRIIYSILRQLIVVSIVLIISILLFNISISINLSSIFILAITLIGMYGIGLIFGGLTLKFKKIDNIVFITQTILLFVSDTLMIYSDSFSLIKLLPITTGNDLIRKTLAGTGIGLSEYLILIIISLSWLLLGILIFNYFKKLSKIDGLLGSY